MSANIQRISELSDGKRSSAEIAALTGLSSRYVRKVMRNRGFARLTRGAQPGSENHQFVSGRRVDLDGYVLVTALTNHPYARPRSNRKTALILEHRLVMEAVLGRYLLPSEVVDHIDGLTLHNAPSNLRLFASNEEHLAHTLGGQVPKWSETGLRSLKNPRHLKRQRVDMYRQRKARGEIRLRQILLAALQLGIDSPFLLGTRFHLEKAGIDASSRSKIERALADLYGRWGSAHTL